VFNCSLSINERRHIFDSSIDPTNQKLYYLQEKVESSTVSSPKEIEDSTNVPSQLLGNEAESPLIKTENDNVNQPRILQEVLLKSETFVLEQKDGILAEGEKQIIKEENSQKLAEG